MDILYKYTSCIFFWEIGSSWCSNPKYFIDYNNKDINTMDESATNLIIIGECWTKPIYHTS